MRMEQKYGRYALNNLPLYLVVCTGIGYFLQMFLPGVVEYLYLNPYLVLKGQVWRLFTWVLMPEAGLGSGFSGMLMLLIVLYCYYILGCNLQYVMGKFRYNLYIFSGLLFTVIGSFVLYFVARVQFAELIEQIGPDSARQVFTIYGTATVGGEATLLPTYWFRSISTDQLKMSMLLAFAACCPEAVFRIQFLIPIKAKWLGIYDLVLV